MPDLVYWSSRAVLTAAWLAVGVMAWRRSPTGSRVWLACAAAAVVCASVRLLRWNYELLTWGRALLRAGGFYEDRTWFKVGLGATLFALAVVTVMVARRLPREPGLRALATALGLQVLLIAIGTLSLDDAMPRWLVLQPGRYLIEGAFAAVALFAVCRQGRPA